MPDWLARVLRTSIQVGIGQLAWAIVKLTVLKGQVSPELDLAVEALIAGVGTIVLASVQNAAENAGVIPALFKPTTHKVAKAKGVVKAAA